VTFEPVVLFFVLGVAAGLLRSDLKIPSSIYDALSIYLLIAIGLQGGVKLADYPLGTVLLDGVVILLVAAAIPLLAFSVLRHIGRMNRADSASIAAHYGSVSVVTFSVGVTFLGHELQDYEGYMVVFLVLLEMPALVIGILLARFGQGRVRWGRLLHEVFFGKSIYLLTGGLVIGYIAGPRASSRSTGCSSTCSRASSRCSCWRWAWSRRGASPICAATGRSWSASAW
jgi:uncharacterized protein